MAILFKLSNNTVRAVDLLDGIHVFPGSKEIADKAGNRFYEAHIHAIVRGDSYALISTTTPVQEKVDFDMLCDFFSFAAKEVITHIYEGLRGRERKQDFNLIAITDDIMKSNLTPLDSPKLEKWFAFGNRIRAKMMEIGACYDDYIDEGKQLPIDVEEVLGIKKGDVVDEEQNRGVQG